MPDQRRRPRRSTDERPTARAVSHLVVLALLAVTVKAGLDVAGVGAAEGNQLAFPFNVISVARGADVTLDPRSVHFELIPEPEVPDPWLERRAPAFLPEPTPLPTPVAPPAPPPIPRPTYVKPAPIVGTGQLAWPVPGGKISQYYSASHRALDISSPSGRAVIASAAGTVTWSGWKNNGGGYVVAIDHGNGIITVYNHLGSLAVVAGAVVTTGQTIAGVGCTGTCTGPHVHYEVIVDGVLVNPLRYL